MAYDDKLAERIRVVFKGKRGVVEKKMFGGICFMLYGNMCCGVAKDQLMLRVGPEQHEDVLKKKYARPMDFTGRPMKGFVFVSSEGFKTSTSLKKWIEYSIKFVKSLPKKI